MRLNVGNLDRVVRAIIGVVLLYLAFFSGMALFAGGVMKWGAVVIGVIMVATAAFSMCPIYSILGLSTRRRA